MNDIDHSTSIKRLARWLRILAVSQLAALGIIAACAFCSNIFPRTPVWNVVQSLCDILMIVAIPVFVIAPFWGISMIVSVAPRPIAIRMYVWGFFLYILFFICFSILTSREIVEPNWLLELPIYIFPFYCFIPQFFIARWWAKKAEDATAQLEYISIFTSPKLRQARRKFLIVLVTIVATPFILLGCLSIYLALIPKPPLVVSKETTYITSPLTADGRVDYFKALEERIYPPELATDDNGFRVFIRLFGDIGYDGEPDDREFYRQQLYEKLGLDPTITPTLVLPLEPDKVITDLYESKGEEVPWEKFDMNYPWTLEEFPMLADWVNEIDEPLNAIAEAIHKPVFVIPLLQTPESIRSGNPQNLYSLRLPHTPFIRSLARHFRTRATYRISQGNIDGAIDDKLSMHRLGRQFAPQEILVQHLVGISIEGMAMAIPLGANPEHPLTEQQIHRVLEGLDALPPRTSFHDILEWERLTVLSMFQEFDFADARGETLFPDTEFALKFSPGRRRSLNYNIVMRRLNEGFDAALEPPSRTKLAAIEERVETWGKQKWKVFVLGLTPGGHETVVGDILVALFVPAILTAESAIHHRAVCAENMHRLALAMLLYQCEHGELPDENWVAGVPAKYLSCPVNPSPEGETSYAFVQCADTVGGSLNTILLVELTEPVAIDKAVITVDEVLERKRIGSLHSGSMIFALRSGAMRFLWLDGNDDELRRLLGRE